MKFDIRIFLENLSKIFKFHQNLIIIIIMGTLHENLYTFMIVSRRVLRMRNVSDEVVEKIKTNILCSLTFSEKRAFVK